MMERKMQDKPAVPVKRSTISVNHELAVDPSIIKLSGVSKHYDTDAGLVQVLVDIQLSVSPGEAIALKGVSGSGKSTLLHIIGAIEKPTHGKIFVAGKEIGLFNVSEQTDFRAKHIGFVFQFFNLIPTLTARENVVAALEPLSGTRAGRDKSAVDALRAVGLEDQVDRYPSQLSGGQQQRVAIARAIAKKPTILLADEPTGALDTVTARQVLGLLNTLRRDVGCAIIIATHDPVVADYVDRVVRIEHGCLNQDSTKELRDDA